MVHPDITCCKKLGRIGYSGFFFYNATPNAMWYN
ncbi:hypothetical protein PAGL106935_03725 [Paenibacillus glucanolyticus]